MNTPSRSSRVILRFLLIFVVATAAACDSSLVDQSSVATEAPGTDMDMAVVDMTAAGAATGLASVPTLPATPFSYVVALPAHYTNPRVPGSAAGADNTPANNPITNAGATLGRVLFYDLRLSANNRKSCASCHRQENGFSDAAVRSVGFQGGLTARHSMSLANARYYVSGRFFWDERAATLEEQVLMPIQDLTEMGMTLDALERKLAATSFYPQLFQAAFGTTEVTRERIARALAQFIRSMTSYRTKYDRAIASGNPAGVLTAAEQRGMQLFGVGPNANGVSLGCNRCHGTAAQIADRARNNGLDLDTSLDQGAGQGRFKVPSLRNVTVTGPYMHDGRFATLDAVIDFYARGVQNHPALDPALRTPGGTPRGFRITPADRDALKAFLGTLTDETMLTDAKFSNPFRA